MLVNMTIKDYPALKLKALPFVSADLCQLLSKVAVGLQLGPPNKAVEVHEEYVIPPAPPTPQPPHPSPKQNRKTCKTARGQIRTCMDLSMYLSVYLSIYLSIFVYLRCACSLASEGGTRSRRGLEGGALMSTQGLDSTFLLTCVMFRRPGMPRTSSHS